jgi:hypothetical protein
VAVDEVERRFGTICVNQDIPHEKIPVTKPSVMHMPNKVSKSPIDEKQLILLQLSLDSKIEKTVTTLNPLGNKKLPLQKAKNPILCCYERTNRRKASFSQFDKIMIFPDAWSISPRTCRTEGISDAFF